MGVQRVALTGSDWLDVREGLKVKQTRQIHDWVKSGMDKDGGEWHFNPVRWATANAAARIVAWSIEGTKAWPGSSASFTDRVDVIEELDETVFDAITKALTEFVDAHKAKETEAKNEMAGGETA